MMRRGYALGTWQLGLHTAATAAVVLSCVDAFDAAADAAAAGTELQAFMQLPAGDSSADHAGRLLRLPG